MNIKELAQAMHNKYGDVKDYLDQRYKSMCKENEKINSIRRAFCDKTNRPFKSTKTEVLASWEEGGRRKELTVVQLTHGKTNGSSRKGNRTGTRHKPGVHKPWVHRARTAKAARKLMKKHKKKK